MLTAEEFSQINIIKHSKSQLESDVWQQHYHRYYIYATNDAIVWERDLILHESLLKCQVWRSFICHE